MHNDVCGDLPKISELPKLVQRPDERLRTFPDDFRIFSEHNRRLGTNECCAA